MHVVVFEDAHVSRLFPVTTGRPAYAVSCASYRLSDWLQRLDVSLRGIVRPHLAEVQRLDYPAMESGSARAGEPVMLVNARLVPSVKVFRTLEKLIRDGVAGVVRHNGEIAAALLSDETPRPPEALKTSEIADFFSYAGLSNLDRLDAELPMFTYPHDVVRYNLTAISDNLEFRLANGNYREARDGVFLAEGARLGDYVVSDTKDGPILIDANASVGSYCYLSGPAWLGAKARLIEHAAIKDAVSINHTTKIGGEVEASVIEAYTNKQHYGFLGHSYLGSWINLGAGTCNSDLKNTYGEVKMQYGRRKVSTGMQFVGSIFGDYAKSAINTGIFTGKTIGVCSMVYGFVTTNVPSFVNYARLFGQVTELSPEVMISTQKRMFARRNVEQRPCDAQLLRDMYQLTIEERRLADEPLAL